jgi:hypothetical protein
MVPSLTGLPNFPPSIISIPVQFPHLILHAGPSPSSDSMPEFPGTWLGEVLDSGLWGIILSSPLRNDRISTAPTKLLMLRSPDTTQYVIPQLFI